MIRGLTRAGLGEIGEDKRFIELAAKYGFQAIEADASSLIRTNGLEGAREMFKASGVKLGSMGLPVEWRGTDEQFRSGLIELAVGAEAASALGCDVCCTYILPSTEQPTASFAFTAVRRLKTIANVLDAYGMKFGLEFVGPHHLRTLFKNPFIYSMEDTLALIDAMGSPNVGLLLDSYHWYTNGLGLEDIEKLSAHQIAYVHVNDAKDLPIDRLLDNDRLYPGEGVIDLTGFLNSLLKIGYEGIVAQEVLLPQPVTQTGEETLQRSKEGFDRIFSSLNRDKELHRD